MVKIRSGERADADTIVEFQICLAEETEGLSLDRATVGRGVQAVFDDPARGRYWVAEADGEVVGCLLSLPEWSDWRNGTIFWIHSLYVRPDFRRQGVFGLLYGHLQKMVQADDSLKGLRLYVEKENLIAKNTYETMGMDGQHYHLYEWMK